MWETNRKSICMLINKTLFYLVSKKVTTRKQGGFSCVGCSNKAEWYQHKELVNTVKKEEDSTKASS